MNFLKKANWYLVLVDLEHITKLITYKTIHLEKLNCWQKSMINLIKQIPQARTGCHIQHFIKLNLMIRNLQTKAKSRHKTKQK